MSVVESSCLEVLVNGVIVELDNIRFSTDFINDFEGQDEDGINIMAKENYEWWEDYIVTYNNSQNLIIEEIEDGLRNEDYHMYICGVEFNDLPEAMRNYYNENTVNQ